MKAMIWKELRENLKWAALAFLTLLLAELYVLSVEQKSFAGYEGFTICGPTFLMITSFGCAAVGGALGAVQILPERRRDQWAAILHRPAPRGVIFFGKAIAGLVLYFLAAGLPLAISACYAATPRAFPAPFVPRMMIPSLSDLVTGTVFYFGALLACLSPGRWFGSRGLVLLAAGLVLELHVSAANTLLVLPVVSSLVLMLGGWGALMANGTIKSMPRSGWIGYVLVVLAGAQVALVLLAMCGDFLEGIGKPVVWGTYAEFRVMHDGQIFHEVSNGTGTPSQMTDMNGKVVAADSFIETYGNSFCQFIPLQPDNSDPSKYLRGYARDSRNYASQLQNLRERELWYVLPRENYLVGYDQLGRRCVGFFDRDGFKPDGAKAEAFPKPIFLPVYGAQNPIPVVSGPVVYELDLLGRTMKKFYDAGDGTVSDVERAYNSGLTAILTDGQIRVFDAAGKELLLVPFPPDPDKKLMVETAANEQNNRFYVQTMQMIRTNDPKAPVLPDTLYEYDFQGNLVHTYSFPGQRGLEENMSWIDRVGLSCVPIGAEFVSWIVTRSDSAAIYTEMGGLPQGTLEEVIAVALGLAAAAFFWARKRGFSNGYAVGWAAVSFVCGIAGLIAFRVASEWPVRTRCPSCGRARVINRDECEHCHAPWSAPESNGMEIMDERAEAVGVM